jgi:putative transposase
VTSRGDRRERLAVLVMACDRFNWVVHAYCQVTNHYHLLV